MEESQHCLWITAHRHGEVVRSERQFLGMEVVVVVWFEFSTVGSWETYVSCPTCIPSLSQRISPTLAGAGKSVLWYVTCYHLCCNDSWRGSVPRSSRILTACGNWDWHRWRFFIVTSGRNKRRTPVAYSHLGSSNFVTNPTPTPTFCPTSTQSTAMVPGNPAMMRLLNV